MIEKTLKMYLLQVNGSVSMQQFDKFEPSSSTNNSNTGGGMSSSNSPTGPIGGPFSGKPSEQS